MGSWRLAIAIPWLLAFCALTTGPGAASESSSGAPLRWRMIEGGSIPVPPQERPRLYLRPEHVGELETRLGDPALQTAVDRMRSLAKSSRQFQMEWNAVQYLIRPDARLARETIDETRRLLEAYRLPKISDAARDSGRMMVTAAIVYDWMYEHLTAEDKEVFARELIRLAGTLECGYPPIRQGAVTGHSSEAMIMRDLISAGIALYDEYPEMYELGAGRFFREHVPARNWFYPGHAYHQGDSYGPTRMTWDAFAAWIFRRLGAGDIFSPEQRFVPYQFIYMRRPDGQLLRSGDTFKHSAPLGEVWPIGEAAGLPASYYGDPYLLDEYLRNHSMIGNNWIFEFLWRDTALQPRPVSELPLARYCGAPFGWMYARTGWDSNAAIVEMKINEYNFCNHQHLDAGAFQIYYKGALAIDSGLYTGSGGRYGSPHNRNYYWRTIAHNSLLIYDPEENFGAEGYGNDGGQRLPNRRGEPATLQSLLKDGYRTGRILAHGFGPDPLAPEYAYLKGDIAQAYSSKAESVQRSFVFLNLGQENAPAALVVRDTVVAANPAHGKYWLLHSIEEPRIGAGGVIEIDRAENGQSGRLIAVALEPAADNREIRKIGGPGKEFWVFGQNYPNEPETDRQKRSQEPGAWRIEISPRQPAKEDGYLVAMLITDRERPAALPIETLAAPGFLGCRIGDRAVFFSTGEPAARSEARFELPPGVNKALALDLAPGQWRIEREGEEAADASVSLESGALYIDCSPGAVAMRRIGP